MLQRPNATVSNKGHPVLQHKAPKNRLCHNLGLALVDLGLLLQDGEPHTLALGQGYQGGVLVANDKHIVLPGNKGVLSCILQLNDVE